MSGPIVRTGTTPKFWKNWDKVFGDKPGAGSSTKKSAKAAAKPATKKKAAAKKKKK